MDWSPTWVIAICLLCYHVGEVLAGVDEVQIGLIAGGSVFLAVDDVAVAYKLVWQRGVFWFRTLPREVLVFAVREVCAEALCGSHAKGFHAQRDVSWLAIS